MTGKRYRFVLLLAFISSSAIFGQENYHLRLKLDSMNCLDEEACYRLEIRTSGHSWILGSQNIRIYYDADYAILQEDNLESFLPPSAYSPIILQSHVAGIDASKIEGELTFERNLGFINFSVDLEDSEGEALLIEEGNSWIPLTRLCFDIRENRLSQEEGAMSLVLARRELTTPYSRAYININVVREGQMPRLAQGQDFTDIDFRSGLEAFLAANCQPLTDNLTEQYVISGQARLTNDNPLSGVSMVLHGFMGGQSTTASDGRYSMQIYGSRPYRLIPYKNDDHMAGVDQDDFELLMDYLKGIASFQSPLQYIAADITGDQIIDIEDAAELFSLLAGAQENLKNNTSYRFVSADYEFPNPRASWPLFIDYPSTIDIQPATNSLENLDFVAIKIGDIDGAYDAALTDELDQSSATNRARIQAQSSLFRISPNPVTDYITIQSFSPDGQSFQAQIYDPSGRLLFSEPILHTSAFGSVKVDVPIVNDGLYFLRLSGNDSSETHRLIIAR